MNHSSAVMGIPHDSGFQSGALSPSYFAPRIIKAAHARHPDVKDRPVGRMRFQEMPRRGSVDCLAYHLQVSVRGHVEAQPFEHGMGVIGNRDAL
jgi:hypothetical protein